MIKAIFTLCLLLVSVLASAEAMFYEPSCESMVNKRERLNCYDAKSATEINGIPLKRNKLMDSQKLIDSYRCSNRLIQQGMSWDDVNKACPKNYQPSDIEYYLESFEVYHYTYEVRYVSVETYEMEKWTFKKYGQFRTQVIFRDGIVYQIIQDRSIRH
ncbi:MAG: hypothetical protein COB23_06205 [Methylophaga sp.]|nr:MAG: hypothetical protein COB23_06205 [Methylophaga sp.]